MNQSKNMKAYPNYGKCRLYMAYYCDYNHETLDYFFSKEDEVTYDCNKVIRIGDVGEIK